MPLWNTPQSGGNTQYSGLNCVALSPGDEYALLNGTEIIVTGSKSVHFALAQTGYPGALMTFQVTGCSAGSVISIQASNGVAQSTLGSAPTVVQTPTNLDASFNTVQDLVAGNGSYSDQGGSMYYRVSVKLFVNGDAPVVIVRLR